MSLVEGTRLGNCRLVRKLGEGGMAEVWEAVDVTLERRVAIKVVRETISSLPEFDARFRREAKVAAQLEHPNVLPIYGFGVEDGIAYIEMPYLSGGTLASRLEAGPAPPLETVCGWVEDLASALDAAHARGIIHRDIKTVNVLFDQSGRIVLGDFGLAKNVADRSGLTATGTLMGTPMYLSPEQARGESLTPRSDQFSLGVLAYRMLAGKLPWEPAAAPAVVMMRIVAQAPPALSSLRPDLPPSVDAVFDRVLAKKPDGRYESCTEFAAALREALLPERRRVVDESPTVITSQPVLVATPPGQAPLAVHATAAPAPAAAPRPRPLPVPQPAPPPRRSGLVVLLVLFLGVNSVVLALVVWDKLGKRLPWAAAPEPTAPAATAVPASTPTPTPTPVATSGPVVVIEQSPAAATPTPPPAEAVTPTPEPSPTPTVVPTATPPPALPAGAIPPVRSSDVRPVFTEELMRRHAGIDGQVELEIVVKTDGSVGSLRVVRGIDAEVDEVVADAARSQLGFTPATLKGKPIPATATVVVGVRFRVAKP